MTYVDDNDFWMENEEHGTTVRFIFNKFPTQETMLRLMKKYGFCINPKCHCETVFSYRGQNENNIKEYRRIIL
jgi:hypothetical protein